MGGVSDVPRDCGDLGSAVAHVLAFSTHSLLQISYVNLLICLESCRKCSCDNCLLRDPIEVHAVPSSAALPEKHVDLSHCHGQFGFDGANRKALLRSCSRLQIIPGELILMIFNGYSKQQCHVGMQVLQRLTPHRPMTSSRRT